MTQSCKNRACVNPVHLVLVPDKRRLMQMVMSKLTWEDAQAIRRLHASGRSKASLIREYRVGCNTVDRILRREIWDHEPEEPKRLEGLVWRGEGGEGAWVADRLKVVDSLGHKRPEEDP